MTGKYLNPLKLGGRRQKDPLSPILLNIVLEEIIRIRGLWRTGTIYRQRHQIFFYVDYIGIVTRNKKNAKTCVKEVRKRGLRKNVEKQRK